MQNDRYETFDDFVVGSATRLLRTAVFLVGGAFWLWGARYLERDTAAVEGMVASRP